MSRVILNVFILLEMSDLSRHIVVSSYSIQADGRVFRDGSEFQRELAIALFALPALLSLEVIVLFVTACRANRDTFRPTDTGHSINAGLLVAKVLDRLLKSF
jgi:hypothetical protein